jgi:hypothetical protein
LLGEIYQAHAHKNEPGAAVTAFNSLTTSLNLHCELDLSKKAAEVEQLLANIQKQ